MCSVVYRNDRCSVQHVMAVNVAVLLCCIVIAVFIPRIGPLLRYTGAVCGMVYVFMMPLLVSDHSQG
eukprot:m.785336 g.785336  ORF g.785336 m.785336 type:complete len:67 (+) comp23301_c0_seq30:76-276(+)